MSITSDLPLQGTFPSKHTSFTRAFLDYTSTYGEKSCHLIDPYTGEKLTFSELHSAVEQVRLQLVGISKGSVIAAVCGNSISVLLTYLAAIDLGIVIMPVNPASKHCELQIFRKIQRNSLALRFPTEVDSTFHRTLNGDVKIIDRVWNAFSSLSKFLQLDMALSRSPRWFDYPCAYIATI
ncbi:hypothetical protein COOONC_18463 [Cooperia oncophora]